MTLDDVKQWGGWVLGAIGTVVAVWNKINIKSLEIKTDGMLSIRTRADRAEAKLEEKHDVQDRADQKEKDAKP